MSNNLELTIHDTIKNDIPIYELKLIECYHKSEMGIESNLKEEVLKHIEIHNDNLNLLEMQTGYDFMLAKEEIRIFMETMEAKGLL